MPPPTLPAVLLEMVQFAIVGEEELEFDIPPPLPLAELPVKTQLVRIGEAENWFEIPPPPLAELAENVQLVMVGEDELFCIPPPSFRLIVFVSTVMLPLPLELPLLTVKPSSTVALASLTDKTTW